MTLRCVPARNVLAALSLLLAAGASPLLANCPGGGAIYQGFAGGQFTGCGDIAYAFVWHHQRAVQRLVNGSTSNGPAGVDSGANATVADGVLYAGTAPGDYACSFDWGFAGNDGCTTLALESDTSCSTGIGSLPVNDFVIAGRTAADPTTALAAVVSVDGNELFASWVLDNAGAPSIDGNPCGADATSFKSPPDISCGAIPRPVFDSVSCAAEGCTVGLSVLPSQAPILDDCEVAQSRALNCTGPAGDRRNLFVGRQLFFKKAPCGTPPADTRVFIMSTTPSPGSATVNFIPYGVEDQNLDGILDAGEDGSGGGTVNGLLDPTILPGNAPESRTVFVPAPSVPGECVYLAIGLALDASPIAPGKPVIAPLLSMNPQPLPASCSGTDQDQDNFTDCQGTATTRIRTSTPARPSSATASTTTATDWWMKPAGLRTRTVTASTTCATTARWPTTRSRGTPTATASEIPATTASRRRTPTRPTRTPTSGATSATTAPPNTTPSRTTGTATRSGTSATTASSIPIRASSTSTATGRGTSATSMTA